MTLRSINKLAALALGVSFTGAMAAAADSSILGRWHGELYGQPAVVLRVAADGGKLSGSILFYFLRDDGEGFKVRGAVTRKLVDPDLKENTFTFLVLHNARHAHQGPNDSLVRFRLEMVSETEGVLKREGSADPPLKLIRER